MGEAGEESTDEGLADLTAAVDQLAERALGVIPPVELAALAAGLHRQTARLEAITARALAAADRAADGPDAFRAVGCQDAAQFLAADAHCPRRRVTMLSRRGRWLTDFPAFAEAWADGVLTIAHVDELRSLDNPRTRLQLTEAQDYLVDAARDCDWPAFRQVCAYWLANADPDGNAPAEQPVHNRVRYRKRADGTVTGSFRLDPLAGAALTTALDTESQRLLRAEQDEEARDRSGARRMADALVNLAIRGHESKRAVTVTPLVNIVMSKDVADNAIARLFDPTVPALELDGENPDRRCELIDGTPIDPRTALVAVAIARFQRIVVDAENRVIEASVQSRSFPPWMKHLLLIQARGRCRAPNCDAPNAWLQADHVNPHSRGGPTGLTNGQVLCDPHNKWKRDHPGAA